MSIKHLTNILINTICHIIIDGQAQQKYYLVTHVIMVLQTMACIADPSSTLYLIVKWSDPSTYLDPSFSIVLTFVIIMTFLLIIIIKLIITQGDDMLVKPNTLKIYMGNILLHLQMLSKTTLLSPLIRSSLIQLQNPSSGMITTLAIVDLTIYLLFLLPLSFYNTSNTFILTPQINKKLNYINIYLILNMFRVIFALVSALNQQVNVVVSIMFFIIFMGLSIKQPVFAYSHQKLIKGMISSIAFVCLCKIFQFIMGGAQQSILLQIIGICCFITFIDWLTQFRVKRILDLSQPTIHQIKILMFLIYNLDQYLQKLQYFIMKHHKECLHPTCECNRVIDHLVSKDGKFNNQKIWYQFLISYIGNYYCLQQIEKLPESQMKLKIQKYQHIVIDLAEIHLFKLGHLNEAYYIVNSYRHQLQIKKLAFLSFKQKRKIINYYMQEEITLKYKTQGVTNLYADNYMNFQIEYEKYRRMLLRSAHKTADMWEQMNKRQPDDAKLHKCIKLLQRWNRKIRTMYQDITSYFQKSADILEGITNNYYAFVLNTSQKSPFHVIEPPKFQNILSKKDQKVQKISQNMQSFSFNSQTPMCFVSVDQQNFGQIMGNNYYFNQVMHLQFGKFTSIEDFMIPQMREIHRYRMKKFIKGDCFSLEHKNGFTLNTKGKIVYTKILVQIMPSILDGLRYVFFLKKLMPRKKILGLKNNCSVVYSSQSYDQAFEMKMRKQPIASYLTQKLIQQIKQKKEVKLQVEEHEYFIKYLHQFSFNDIQYLFLQFYEEDDVLLQTKYNLLGQKIENTSKNRQSDLFRPSQRKDSIISRDSGSQNQERSNMGNSDMQEKSVNDKIKKVEENVRNIYSIIVDDKKKHIIRRVLIFIVITTIIMIAIELTLIILKLQNQDIFLSASGINQFYNNFMLLLTRATSHLKLTNLYGYQNQTTLANSQFATLQTLTNINKAMDNLVVNFNITYITQSWKYFACNANNATFTVASQNNFLSISDYIQNPVTNLIATTVKNLSFPIAMQYLPLPLTPNMCQYYEMVTNCLYTSLPNYRLLKVNVMNPITVNNINVQIIMLVIFLIHILLNISFIIGMVLMNSRITNLKNYSYDLFEGLDKELIREKQSKCRQFLSRYTEFDDPEHLEETNTQILKNSGFELKDGISSGLSVSKNMEKTVDDVTQRELDFNQNSKNLQNKQFQLGLQTIGSDSKPTKFKQKTVAKNENYDKIFQKSSNKLIIIKYILPVLPFIIFCIVFGSLQIVSVQTVKNNLQIQQKIQTMQQNINLIRLYAMHYSIYSSKLQIYQSIPAFLDIIIRQMYTIQRALVGKYYSFKDLPTMGAFIQLISYSDLCIMFSHGLFAVNNTKLSNITKCYQIGQGILSKGFYSSLINYLQSINTLVLANPNMTAANATQKLAFLNSNFFKDDTQLIDYFDAILDTIQTYFNKDFISNIKASTNMLIFTIISVLCAMSILLFFLGRMYIKSMILEIIQMTAIFLFISYESILKNQTLKNKFVQKMQDFKKLK